MVMTVLEVRVASENQPKLKAAYTSAIEHLDQGIVETFMVADTRDSDLWRILTIWEDRGALDAMRSSGQPPRGVLIFKEAGADPALSILEVVSHMYA
jgi:hypothetical protein